MAIGGNSEGSTSYEEFDSSEFETDQSEQEESNTEDAEKSEKEEVDPDKKLTAEEAFGEDDAGASKETTEEEVQAASGETAEKPAYEPNLKYKVYDEEREFPEQLKSLVKDKDTEEYFRGLLSKADGLDEMKPRHQETIQQRDDFKSQADYLKQDINRVLTLRDEKPHLFAAEVGLTDDWVIARAKEIVAAKETPEAYDQFREARKAQYDAYNANLKLQHHQQTQNQEFVSNVQTQIQQAIGSPEVSGFQRQFDSVHGEGAFQEEVRKEGYYHFERTKLSGRPENLAPQEAVRRVFEFHKKTFSVAAPQGGESAADKTGQTKPAREVPKPLPNIGKGRNVSPVRKTFKSIKEIREYVNKHVPSN